MGLIEGKTYRILDPRKIPEAEYLCDRDDGCWVVDGSIYRVQMLNHVGKTIVAPNNCDSIDAFTWYWHPWMLEEVKPSNIKRLLKHVKGL